MPGQKCNFAPCERSEDISVRRRAERSLHSNFVYFRQSLHRVEAAAADNADLCLCQTSSGKVRVDELNG